MLDSLRLYAHYIDISFRSQMQYRSSFIILSIGNFLTAGLEFIAILVLFERFGHLQDWSLPEIALFYSIINMAFSLCDSTSRGFELFASMVKSGEFDRLLIRPRSTALQLAGQEVNLRKLGRFLQALIVLLWAISTLDLFLSPEKILLIVFAILGGACLFYGLIIIRATLAFWTTESLEIMNTVTYGGVETAQYPLIIYRPWFRRFFTFVIPLACISYYPAIGVLDRLDPLNSSILWQWVSPAIGVLFLILCLQIWKFGVRHYRSTGS